MPFVTVKLLEGRTNDQKRAIVEKITTAVVESANVPAERVHVIIEEMSPNNYGHAGVRISDKDI